MFDRFTDRARKVLGLSRQEALRLNHDYIGTEHVLLGLILEGNGVAIDVFKNLDVDPKRLREETLGLLTRGKAMVTMGQLPFTPRAKKVLELALEEASSLGHNYIGTEHLLLGLIREEKGIAAQVLRAQSLGIEEARDEVRELIGSGAPGQHEPGPLDPHARRVMETAGREAQRSGHDRIGTEHILLALLHEETAGELAGALLGRLRLAVEGLMARGAEPVAEPPASLAPAAKAALDLAFQAAGQAGAVKVSSAHLLLGLIREKEGIAAKVLADAGVTAADVLVPTPPPLRTGAPPLLDFDRFADRSRLVMGLARQEAQRWSHDCIGTAHMLLGLMEGGGGAVEAVLKGLGVEPQRARTEVERRMTPGNTLVTMGQLPFTPSAKRVLEMSFEEAGCSGAAEIREEHLLLGLLREEEGIAAEALTALGVTLAAVRRALGPPAPPD